MKPFERVLEQTGPIGRKPVRELVQEKLSHMIRIGMLRPGDELPSERQIASSLNVSRESVRAALAVMNENGMIRVAQGTRTVIVGSGKYPLDQGVKASDLLRGRSAAHIHEARAILEAEVVQLAAQRISEAQLERLRALAADQAGMIDDSVAFQMSDAEFHGTLYEACGNPILFSVLADLFTFDLEAQRTALSEPGLIGTLVAEHQAIVQAISTKDLISLESVFKSHVGRL